MKKLLFTLTAAFCLATGFAQRSAEDYYNDGMKYAEKANYKEAILYFDMSIRLKSDDYFVWYNRGISKALSKNYRGAIADYAQTMVLKPDYTKAFISTGTCYKLLNFYDTAAAWYSAAVVIDEGSSEAYYRRAGMYETMNMRDSAAADYKKAFEMGVTQAEERVKYYADTVKSRVKFNTITKLKETSADPKYGFSAKQPVKVGTGPKGGPANITAYLNLLTDARKKPVRYRKTGSCCAYKPAGYTGNVLVDEYELLYSDETGAEKKTTVYFSYHEYEEPKVLLGLNTPGK